MTTNNALNISLAGQTGTGLVVGSISSTLTSPTFITPILGTPASGNLANCTNLPVGSLNGLAAGMLNFLQAPTSSNLRTTLTDETGTGLAVFNTNPTFITPILGTPASGDLINCTGYPASSLTGFITPPNGGTGVSSPTAHGLLIAEGASAMVSLVLGAGQIPIGTTSLDPVAATLTAGSGISISSNSGSISISSTGSGSSTWSTATSNTAMSVNNGYIVSSGSPIVMTLPATAAIGEYIKIAAVGSGTVTIAQNTGQQVFTSNSTTTIGVTGNLTNISQYNTVELRCVVANTSWILWNQEGSGWTLN